MEIAFGLWIASGILCAMIASNKGHNAFLGCIGGALFGVFAIIYYVAIPAKRRER